ncbi:MAG: ergothioneine biosynthesis protein EgtC [Gammaproteobacteria bacterium]|nr:ergothioneine biosynthesis protein EgtC [Gammaproteobacteria bacterium]
MCRLAAYLGPPLDLQRFLLAPEHSLYRQSWAPREMREAVLNADGYGFGWRTEQGQPATYVCTQPIWADGNLPGLAISLRSPLWLANVRSATPGQAVNTANTQPFLQDDLMYLHNGYLQDFNDGLRAQFHHCLPAAAQARIQGSSDSEYLLALILRHRSPANGMTTAALRAAWQELAEMMQQRKALLNVILAHGERLLVSRHALNGDCPSLYYCTGSAELPGAVRVASERLDPDPNWRSVPEHCLLVLESGEVVAEEPL